MIRKYLKRKYLEKFQETGELLIGNIEKYRLIEDSAIRDEKEGVKIYESSGEPVPMSEIIKFSKGSSIEIITDEPLLKDFNFCTGIAMKFHLVYPNALVFCTSGGELSQMKNRFKKDYFFTITDPQKFGQSILSELISQGFHVDAFCFDWVTYIESKNLKNMEKIVKKENVIHAPLAEGEVLNLTLLQKRFGNYFTKEKNPFETEKEYRFLFSCEEKVQTQKEVHIYLPRDIIKKCILFE